MRSQSPAAEDFYGTGIEIWAGFGPVGITEKNPLGPLWATFEAVFMGKKNKNIEASEIKSCIKWSSKKCLFFFKKLDFLIFIG